MSKILIPASKNPRELISEVFSDFKELVVCTAGPGGENILLHTEATASSITKDGVTVANAISYDCEVKNIIADIIKQAARKTNENAGDGTTTATCIAAELYEAGSRQINANSNLREFYSDLESATLRVLEELNKMKTEFTEKEGEELYDILFKIAMISTNADEEISKMIARAFCDGGKDAVLNVESGADKYELINVQGTKIPTSGIIHHAYLENEIEKKITLKDCHILVTTHELESSTLINDLQEKILLPIIKANRSLLIITPKADKAFLANMVNNKNKGTLKNCIVKTPYFGLIGKQFLKDISAYAGATIIEESTPLKNVDASYLGFASKIEATPWHTTLYEPERDAAWDKTLQGRIAQLETKIKKLSKKDLVSEKVKERLATITGKVYKLRIPATSEVEDSERADRVEDAMNACRGSFDSGYLPGGGVALMKASLGLNRNKIGERIIQEVCHAPFRSILLNAKENPDLVKMKVATDPTFAYDIRTGKTGECLDIGIVDSHKVIKEAFTNGISVSKTLLTTKGIIANKKVEAAPMMPY